MKPLMMMVMLASAACSAQEQNNARTAEPSNVTREAEKPGSRPPAKSESAGSASSTTSAPKKDERGNTPVGQTRAGEAPAAGAIADPEGATKR